MLRLILCLSGQYLRAQDLRQRDYYAGFCVEKSKQQNTQNLSVVLNSAMMMHLAVLKEEKHSLLFAERLCYKEKKLLWGKKAKENQTLDGVEENIQSLNLPRSWVFFLIS